MLDLLGPIGTVIVIVAIVLVSGIKILREYERGVTFRLGRMVAPRGPASPMSFPLSKKCSASTCAP